MKVDELLPQTGKLRESLENWIDEKPLAEFTGDIIQFFFLDKNDYQLGDNLSQPLQQIFSGEEIEKITDEILRLFQSLPWRYTLTLNLGTSMTPLLNDTETGFGIDGELSLRVSDLFFESEYPIQHPDENINKRVHKGNGLLVGLAAKSKWEEGVKIQVVGEGFIGPFGGGPLIDHARNRVRSFLGIGLALKLFSFERRFGRLGSRLKWTIHRYRDSWTIDNTLDIEADDSEVIKSLKIRSGLNDDPVADDPENSINGKMVLVQRAISSPRSDTLKLAGQWFFDSFKGSDDILSYVRLMVCLEILMGEKADTSKLSLGELIGNRLAYLIGRTHKERAAVLSDFRDIYGVRSRILHHGKHALRREERLLMSKLRSFCERALSAEARLLADED